jgi:hypothetical protein
VTIVTIEGFTNVCAAVAVTDDGAASADGQPPAGPIIFACLFETLPVDEKRGPSEEGCGSVKKAVLVPNRIYWRGLPGFASCLTRGGVQRYPCSRRRFSRKRRMAR